MFIITKPTAISGVCIIGEGSSAKEAWEDAYGPKPWAAHSKKSARNADLSEVTRQELHIRKMLQRTHGIKMMPLNTGLHLAQKTVSKPKDTEADCPPTTRSPVVIKILDDEIELHQTIKGDELKYWIDGYTKYLCASDCRNLAQTMTDAAILLESKKLSCDNCE